MDFPINQNFDFETDLSFNQERFDYNCSRFRVQEIDLRLQIKQAKYLVASLDKLGTDLVLTDQAVFSS